MTQPLTSIPQPSTQQPGRRVAWPRYAHTHPARLLGTHENEQALSRPPSPPCGRRAGVTVKLQSIQASKHQARRWNFSEGAERSVQNSSVQMHVATDTERCMRYPTTSDLQRPLVGPCMSLPLCKKPQRTVLNHLGVLPLHPPINLNNAEPLAREAKAGFDTTIQPTRLVTWACSAPRTWHFVVFQVANLRIPTPCYTAQYSLRLWSIVALYSVVPLSSTHLCLQGRRSRLKSPSLLTLHALGSVRHNYFGFRFNSATKDRHDIFAQCAPLNQPFIVFIAVTPCSTLLARSHPWYRRVSVGRCPSISLAKRVVLEKLTTRTADPLLHIAIMANKARRPVPVLALIADCYPHVAISPMIHDPFLLRVFQK
ncbi:uncharacterized protein CLUP02_03391 [Colletotrichum lupini]|uniref:Uncharacterized protein n=1 Tax=Colletotrichum lupini TaxID=145971 RepID=A0A9Q8WBR7_9PEZI|nr:uncharacterized protein CLUP02_03391 [Colletotrichum lupini]UQC77918.1 hypothetical protein CLUP02_03391 [Colletotrichum lupini]